MVIIIDVCLVKRTKKKLHEIFFVPIVFQFQPVFNGSGVRYRRVGIAEYLLEGMTHYHLS